KLRYEGIAIASRIPRMMITTSSSISVKPRCSLEVRRRVPIGRVIGCTDPSLSPKERGRGLPRPLGASSDGLLAVARLDVGSGAGLVVEDRARGRVDDAVGRRVGDRDLDVLDPGVVRALQLGQRHARVAGGVGGGG